MTYSGVEHHCYDSGQFSLLMLAQVDFDTIFLRLWFWNELSVPETYLHTIRSVWPDSKIIVLTDDAHTVREQMMVTASPQVSFLWLPVHALFSNRTSTRKSELMINRIEYDQMII
jgi:hypothetical protein